MKNTLYFILLVIFSIFTQSASAQDETNEQIALRTLKFLDKELNINFKKMGEPILISFRDNKYICNVYVDTTNISPIARIRFFYELTHTGDNFFDFYLKAISEFRGSFQLRVDDGISWIHLIRYVQRSD
jgi:hypothetical protein